MKKPTKPKIKDIKEKKFSMIIESLKHRPHNDIVNSIDSKMFSLDGNTLYHHKPEVLAGEEYKRCYELFERRLKSEFSLPTQEAVVQLQMQLQMIDNVMFNKEVRHIDRLKQIAVDTVRQLFDIPEHVQILPDISKGLDVGSEDQDDSPEPILSLTIEQSKEMYQEIQKRIILNGIVHGGAMHIWKSAHYIVKEQIDELDPMLMMLYDQYTTSIGWLLWQMSPSAMQESIEDGDLMTQGFNKLEFKEQGGPDCDIHCSAINFPVLLHEVTKGALDYLICRGIPSNYSEEELRYYYAVADSYENEFWHYLLSPTVWIKLVDAADVDTQSLPQVIANLTKLSYEDLSELLKACIDDKEIGNKKLKEKRII